MTRLIRFWSGTSLIKRIIVAAILGIILGLWLPQLQFLSLLGDLFVGALKAMAPLLVFFLVTNALSQAKKGQKSNMKQIIVLYLLGTFAAALIAVLTHYIFPVHLKLDQSLAASEQASQDITTIFKELLLKLVDNPIAALVDANYIGILLWAVVFGIVLRAAHPQMKTFIAEGSKAVAQVVSGIINLAPFGILGLVFAAISESGLAIIADYGYLLLVLVGTMAFVAVVINPLIGFIVMGRNPFPLLWQCLRVSGVTAFFTRSSAANIPVNMKLCEDLGLDPDTYFVSIPLGATVNMAGAAVTINVLTLAAVTTLGITVDFPTALLLSFVSSIAACGASGITGGSLLLIPVASSLFGISNDIAMQVVGVGFIVGIIQDSCETALNSSTDVYFTAVAEKSRFRKS